MICPKCGRPVNENAVICPGCDFILDTSFLGDEILDEDRPLRPGRGGVAPSVFNLADAVILGDIDESTSSFETSDSGFHARGTGARLYVSGRSHAMMAPDAIPALLQHDPKSVRLTPFERHVLRFIDGERAVEQIRIEAGLEESEVKTALATLADKGVVEVIGRKLMDLDSHSQQRPRRRPDRRRIRESIAGALAEIGDEADLAFEEAFQTQTGMAAVKPEELADFEDASQVLSELGDPEPFFERQGTRELESLAASSMQDTPLHIPKQRLRISSGTGSFDSVSGTLTPTINTKDLQSLLGVSGRKSDTGFEDPTRPVDMGLLSSHPLARGDSKQVGDFGLDGMAAFAKLANSELAGTPEDEFDVATSNSVVAPRVVAATPPGPAAAPPKASVNAIPEHSSATNIRENPLSTGLSQLLSDSEEVPSDSLAADAGFAENTGAFLDDDFSGDEYSEEEFSEPTSSERPSSREKHAGGARAAAAPAPVEESLSNASLALGVSVPSEALEALLDDLSDDELSAELLSEASAEEISAEEIIEDSDEDPALSRLVNGISDISALNTGAVKTPDLSSGDVFTAGAKAGAVAATNARPAPAAEPSNAFEEPTAQVVEPPLDLLALSDPARALRVGGKGDDNGETLVREGVDLSSPSANTPPVASRRVVAQATSSSELVDDDMFVRPIGAGRDESLSELPLDALEPLEDPMSFEENTANAVVSSRTADVPSELLSDQPSSEGGPGFDADATLHLRQNSRQEWVEAASPPPNMMDSSDYSGDFDEGTDDYKPQETAVTGDDSAASADVPGISDSGVPASPRGRGSGLNTAELKLKAQRLFADALRDFEAGRESRAKMNAKLASIYDPHNEEYRAALEQWQSAGGGGHTNNKSEEVLLYEEAQRLEAQNQTDEAIVLLRKGININPGIAAFHNRLGVILALRKQRYDEAAECVRRAIELEPENMHYKSNYGKILSKAKGQQRMQGNG